MKKRIIAYGLVFVIIAGGIFAVVKNKNKPKFLSVKTAEAKVGDIQTYLSTTAVIKSKNTKDYYGLQAKVKKASVKVGDKVKKGDVLVTYEVQDLTSSVNQAQLQYDNAVLQKTDTYNQNTTIKNKIADLNKQISDYDNTISTLKSSKDPSDAQKLTQTQNTQASLKSQRDSLSPYSSERLKQADNAVALAKIALDQAKQKAGDNESTIVSDVEGTVTDMNVEEGSVGSAAQIAVVVQNVNSLKAVASLGKFDASKVIIGQIVNIINDDKTYTGKISYIDPVAKKTASQAGGDTALSVEADIEGDATNLKIDFDADIDILVAEAKGVLTIPSEALKTEKGNKNYVYVLDASNVVHQKAVTVGIQSDNYIEIKDGIKAGEKVILNPSTSITEGILAKDSSGVK